MASWKHGAFFFFSRTMNMPSNENEGKEVKNVKGYYERSSYVGFMPDGTKQRFPTWQEYVEAYEDAENGNE